MCFPFFAWYLTLPHVTQATQIDRLAGSVANGLNSSSRFFPRFASRPGSLAYQWYLVPFLSGDPARLAVSTSESLRSERIHPEYPGEGRAHPHRGDHSQFTIPSPSAASPIIYIHLRSATSNVPNTSHDPCFARAIVVRYREPRGVLQDIAEEPKCSCRISGSRMCAVFASRSW